LAFSGDKVKIKRAENIIKLCEMAKKRLAEKGIEEPASANRKLALSILAAAADENSEDLQVLWARLLAAAMNPDQSKQGRLGFTDALKGLDPLDARVLVWLHKHGGRTDVDTQNKMAGELGVSRPEGAAFDQDFPHVPVKISRPQMLGKQAAVDMPLEKAGVVGKQAKQHRTR
jgi:hypothetical protein